MNPTLRQKASFIYNSNKIEGLGYPLEETLSIIQDWLNEKDEYERTLMEEHYKTVIFHYMALEHVLTQFRKHKPEWIDVMDIHKILMEQQLPSHQCGFFRDIQVYIGQHVPPAPGAKLISSVEKFVRFLTTLDDIKSQDELYREIYHAHCRFENIHPFRDGNGRSGRLFWLALLNYYGFEFNEISYDDQQIYYRSLQQRRKGVKLSNLWYPSRPYLEWTSA